MRELILVGLTMAWAVNGQTLDIPCERDSQGDYLCRQDRVEQDETPNILRRQLDDHTVIIHKHNIAHPGRDSQLKRIIIDSKGNKVIIYWVNSFGA